MLAEGHESRGAGILSEVPPTPQSESFKHDAILVKIQGEFFFLGGGGGPGSKNNVKYSHGEESCFVGSQCTTLELGDGMSQWCECVTVGFGFHVCCFSLLMVTHY